MRTTFLLMLFLCTRALAAPPSPLEEEEDRAEVPASANAIVPPALVVAPELEHPLSDEEARALGPVSVVVLVTVGADGAVQGATVVEETSHPDARLQEAALVAARGTRFEPATQGGAPLAVQLPFELKFTPPPGPPVVDGVALEVALPGAMAEASQRAFDPVALGQSLAVGGALVLSAGVLFTSFSGVTALDNATRQEELAKTPAERTSAERTRAYGGAMLIPFAGPLLALPSAPDASTALFTGLGAASHLAGAALLATGGGLLLAPLFLVSEPATASE